MILERRGNAIYAHAQCDVAIVSGEIVRGLLSGKRFWAISVVYDQRLTTHGGRK